MFAYQDRLLFAQSVLAGEEDAHHILADMLEEEGDRALAQWARAKKKSRFKRLDFVLAVLPHLVTLQTAADFLERSLAQLSKQERRTYHMTNNENMSQMIQAVQGIGNWSKGTSTDEELATCCTRISAAGPWAYGIKDLDLTMQTLHLGATNASLAESNVHDRKLYLKHSNDARNACRRVAKASREMLKPLTTQLLLREDPVSWQLEYVRGMIAKLSEAANDSIL